MLRAEVAQDRIGKLALDQFGLAKTPSRGDIDRVLALSFSMYVSLLLSHYTGEKEQRYARPYQWPLKFKNVRKRRVSDVSNWR